ncbi:MAG: DsrE family protein [Eubacteriales bacterium]|nr:DsrE family protein [Eubacteriales bacterium]
MNVVFHVDETRKWPLTLHNARNLLDALGDEPGAIEIVANAEAVNGYMANQGGSNLLEPMRALSRAGVVFAACQNALRAYTIGADALPDFVMVVPAGVLELAKRQQQGYAYIKP